MCKALQQVTARLSLLLLATIAAIRFGHHRSHDVIAQALEKPQHRNNNRPLDSIRSIRPNRCTRAK
jgi:hypothetical protein